MNPHRHFFNSLRVVDLVIMLACFTVAAILVAPTLDVTTIREFMELRVSLGNFLMLGGLVVLWHLLFSSFGLYKDSLDRITYPKIVDVLKATSVGACCIVALSAPFEISFVGVRFILIFWTSVSLLSFYARLIARKMMGGINDPDEKLRSILIVGVNSRAVRIAHQIDSGKELGYRLAGFVDDTAIHAKDFDKFGYKLVAGYQNLAEYLGKTPIDEVLVCLPLKSRYEDIANVVSVCEEQGIAVGILRDLFSWNLTTSSIRQIGEQTIVTLRPHTINGGRAASKRLLDILISAALIALLLPVFIITALLVKLSSPGPAIFAQERIGVNKRRFKMLKFRTMVAEAEQQQAALEHCNEAAAPVFKISADPRITPLGKFLRKSSIDELPQLLNVLKGEMSLVGPRPLPTRDYEGFSQDWHRRRVSIRPGITGLWQVNGRDQSSFDEWVKLDLEYIDRWSLALDFQILLRTLPAVLRGTGE